MSRLLGIFVLAGFCGAQTLAPYERLRDAAREPGNWLMYSGGYNGWRYSQLNQINTGNVGGLRVQWLFQAHTAEKYETTPLVVDGIMYLTRPENEVVALDAVTGRTMWTYVHRNPEQTYNCCGRVNRGLAILGNRLYMNTLDMHVIAIDARSGREVWKTKIYDYDADEGYAATGAPLAVKDKIIVGMAGGEHPGAGFLDAYDAATGARVWRFHTIPQPGEPNFGTWAGDSWKTGGVATWNNGSYDPETNTLFWGTSNPWPDFAGDEREGDNLYSCSALALDPDTGKLKWYFQFTPHDTHDWDATQIPILLDGTAAGQPNRKLVAWPARNGFYYLLDRITGKFILAKSFVRQTWNAGFDENGRPKVNPGQEPTEEGATNIFPGVDGAANWMPPSFSPLTRLLYVFARDERRIYPKYGMRHRDPPPNRDPDRVEREFAPEEGWGKVVAIDPFTGDIRWEHKFLSPGWGGVMSTAGNLVFGGPWKALSTPSMRGQANVYGVLPQTTAFMPPLSVIWRTANSTYLWRWAAF